MVVSYMVWFEKDLLYFVNVYSNLESFVVEVDVLVVVVSGGVDMLYLINVEMFKVMKFIVYFVNILCGEVVDEMVLIVVFQVKDIVGVGLDVYEFEFFVFDVLIVMVNVMFLLYLGIVVFEVCEGMELMVVENLKVFVVGDFLLNRVQLCYF